MEAIYMESTIENGAVQHHAVAMALEMPEILENIFGHLLADKTTDLINPALVCRKWRDAAYYPSLWRRKLVCLFLKPSYTFKVLPILAKRRIQNIHLLNVPTHMRNILPLLPLLQSFCFGQPHSRRDSSSIMTDTLLCDVLNRRHTALTSFMLYDCKEITDISVILLSSRLPNLEWLGLAKCPQVTDAGFVAAVCGLPRLYFLSVRCCAITDAGVTELVLLRPEVAPGTFQLRELNMSRSGITDNALLHISTVFPKLEVLLLRDCAQLTDSGLGHLGNMSSLKYIDVGRSTCVTKDRLNQLQSELKLKIEYAPARYPW